MIKQYVALIGTEGVELAFMEGAIKSIAKYAARMNSQMENIGARRLHAMMEHLLEEISFDASEGEERVIEIDEAFVRGRLESLVEDSDARKYLL
jgi:ATP-dependent HslUV protease ATP-binding subunit HslU